MLFEKVKAHSVTLQLKGFEFLLVHPNTYCYKSAPQTSSHMN